MNKDGAVAPHQFGPGLNSEVDAILLLGLVLLRGFFSGSSPLCP